MAMYRRGKKVLDAGGGIARRRTGMAVEPDTMFVLFSSTKGLAALAMLMLYERLGLCAPGEGPRLIDEGVTTLKGRQPVNPSGGLCSRGHPVGATGLLQIAELVWQMRGEAGARQIEKPPKVTMAQNQGGLLLGQDSAVYGVTILKT